MALPILTLRAGHMERILHGHPWVFSNELAEVPTQLEPGTLVEVRSAKGPSLGLGFFNPHQLVAVRLLHLGLEDGPAGDRLDGAFFVKRLTAAKELRERLWGTDEALCARVCYGESDGMPGLVLDRYGSVLVAEILSAGMEKHRDVLVEALKSVFPEVTGVLLRHDSALRALEGLPMGTEEVLYGDIPARVSVVHEGMKLDLALAGQQKTGYFLDQRENRRTVRQISKGLTVLDLFTNQGGFALQAALGGAAEVTAVDASAEAIGAAKAHAAANAEALAGVKMDWVEMDVFRFLENAATRRDKWDLVIVDPPAFAKSKKKAAAALHGYEKLNGLALKVVRSGGFLATGSCSMHVDHDRFFGAVGKAARVQQKRLVLLMPGAQAADHPMLAAMPETRYLKWATFKVMSPY